MASDPDALLSFDDAASIGFMVANGADRLRPLDKIVPGSRATISFIMDDTHYQVEITVKHGD